MLRRLTLALLAASLAAPLAAQGLADAAAREKERRARAKRAGTPGYTDEDLKGRGGAKSTGAAEAQSFAASSADESTPREADKAEWVERARSARTAIASAEVKVKEIQARIDRLRTDRDPTRVMDPFRLQSVEAELAKAMQDLEAARRSVDEAKKALVDLEDEARRKRVPSAWLREE